MVTFGKAVVDIVRFVSMDGKPLSVSIPIDFKVGNAKGELKVRRGCPGQYYLLGSFGYRSGNRLLRGGSR
jgi:hypothetical protein